MYTYSIRRLLYVYKPCYIFLYVCRTKKTFFSRFSMSECFRISSDIVTINSYLQWIKTSLFVFIQIISLSLRIIVMSTFILLYVADSWFTTNTCFQRFSRKSWSNVSLVLHACSVDLQQADVFNYTVLGYPVLRGL